MEFRILGPLEVRDRRGVAVPLQGPRQCALLAILILHANETVSIERLIDELWGTGRPPTAPNALQVHVSHLRRVVADALVTEPGGYRLAVDPERVDATRFERLAAEGRAAVGEGRLDEGSTKLRAAVALWRGSALAEFRAEPFAQGHIARLEDLRLAAIEDRIDAELASGDHAELVAELEGLVAEHPLRERLRGQLMLALYRDGRQGEALDEFQRARRVLVAELGIEPSPGLKALQASILRQDAALERESRKGAPWAPGRHERRTVTVACAAFSASTNGRDPEAAELAGTRALDAAEEIVRRHRGRLLEASRDRLLAVFGLPPASEEDALRALRAAVEIRDEIDDGDLTVSLGVETGPVLLRPTAPGQTGVVGDVLGEVPRLAYAAGNGEILIGESTRRLVGHALRFEAVAPPRADSGRLWRLTDITPELPAIPRLPSSPLVNREHELQLLLDFWGRTCQEAAPGLVTVLGPAGIGKSRLVTEFCRLIAAEASVFVGRCLPYGDGITFWPLAEVVEQAAGERAPGALAQRLGGGEAAGTIAERVSGALGGGGGVAGTEETFWAVRRFLEGLARRRPIVVVFEDVHWAQPIFLDLVEHVAGLAQDVPLLLVCLARPELLDGKPAWGHDQPNALSIVVEPLSEDDSAELVQQLVEESPFSLQNRSRIVETAGGNPLFIEELVRVTTESPEPDAEIARFPPTIQAVLAARLDQLEPDERAVLEAASVIGRELWLAALAELTPEREQGLLRQRLGALVDKDLLRPDEREGAAAQAFRFRHLLIRDAAYEAIPKVRRAELHRRFADWLEQSSFDRLTEVQEIVAFHLEEAFRYRTELAQVDAATLELAERAASHLAAAARRAHAREDLPAEISLLSRAVALLPARDSRRLALLPELGDALREAGDFSQAGFVLEEARKLAAASGDEAIAAFASVIQLLVRFRTGPELPAAKVSAEAQRAVHILQRRGADRWLAKNWELLALVAYRACRAHEAEPALERVVHYARRAEDSRQESRALSLLFGTAVFGPLRVEDGVRRCESALRRYPTSLGIKASATRALATLTSMRGDFEQARLLVAHDKALAAELGRPLSSARASIAYGIFELLADEPAAAEAELRAGYDSLSEVGEKGWLSHVAPLLAEALYRQGRDDEALELIEEAKQVVAPEDLTAQVYWRSPLSKILARQGRDEEAEQLAEEAIEIARRTDSTNLVGDAYKDAADVYLEGGRVDVASAYLRKAINRYDRKGNRAGARKTRRLLAELATPVGHTRAAGSAADQGATRISS